MIDNNSFNSWFNQRYEVTDKNKIKAKGKNRYFTESDVYFEYEQSYKSLCMPITFTEQEVVNELRSKYRQISNVKAPNTIANWISQQIPKSPYKISRAGRQIEYIDGGAVTNADINNLSKYLQMVNSKDNGRSWISCW